MKPSPSTVRPQVCHASPTGYVPALAGIARRTMGVGVHTLLTEFKLAKGAVVPCHSHPQEQTGYLVSGHLRFLIAGVEHVAHAGDSWTIPGGVEHSANVLEDSVAIEVFSPVRDDYRS
ncbi:MAG TPA: cupin domain-containing protein [Opitutaceae bacterium]|nr:cupin domain-containing protein [Opitutaceae bacterium]